MEELQGLFADNPLLTFIWHIDYLMVQFDVSTWQTGGWKEDRFFERPDQWQDMYAYSSGQPLGHSNERGGGWALNWAMNQSNREFFMDRQLDNWTDYDSANGHLNNGLPSSWMQDTVPVLDFFYVHETQIGLMHERCCLKRLPWFLLSHLRRRQFA